MQGADYERVSKNLSGPEDAVTAKDSPIQSSLRIVYTWTMVISLNLALHFTS